MVVDVALIGAGVMSATLGTLLRELEPGVSIHIYERLDRAAAESSDAWNNAGTGHSGFCELNYTPPGPDGTVDVSKAIRIAEQYELSKQLWASLARAGTLPDPRSFIRTIPHMSFVWGERDVAFLRARHHALQASPLFREMELSEDRGRIAELIPLMMDGRGPGPVAATHMPIGNDVNFGALTRSLIERLAGRDGVEVHLAHEVRDFERNDDGTWSLEVCDLDTDEVRTERARFVFIGAGGGSQPLLEKTGIPEGDGFGAFPVSGQWLRCTRPEIIEQHHCKVYGQAQVGAPPMSVPHLDTRWVDGEKELLFGPYAGFSTKFLKKGSYLDLFRSLAFDNIGAMLSAGLDNIDLTRYLVGQALMSPDERIAILRRFLPAAQEADWEHRIAGQRVQIIASDGDGGGVLKFGTEVVTSADGTVAALLGASPGASTAVAIMVDLLGRCFPERFAGAAWQARLRELLPSFGYSLHADPARCAAVREATLRDLALA
ncbi:MAG: malate dehydrogenase (quinone) [Sandaracinaceae bacterium]|nr:malate dehydrogenase (quinone) [Sandaracinaceae bacterium]